MRISDWSSDVCSSDLLCRATLHGAGGIGGAGLRPHLVTTDRLEADRLQHVDAIDMPADCRLPVDRLQYVARRRRRHHVVTDPLDLHLRPREARSAEHTSELQSLMRIPYAVFCLKQ